MRRAVRAPVCYSMNTLSTLLFFIFFLSACSPKEPALLVGNTMGTTYSVKIVGEVKEIENLQIQLDEELQNINDLMSTYIVDSELSKFNQSPMNTSFPLSRENFEVFSIAKEIHAASGGQFDVTIGPLVNLWGFGPDFKELIVPADKDILLAKSKVGMQFLKMSANAVSKTEAVYVDLSAIAKGYGVDVIADLLDAKGYENYLVEIGGELRAKGLNDRGKYWRVAIEKPDVMQRTPYKAIELRNSAMATSGDYRNYFEVDGVRFSHTISPISGRPITHNVASVTVIEPSTAKADGYATAINVMGVDEGIKMSDELGLAVLIIIKTENGFEERYSSKYKGLIESQQD
jgi:thiamine biosynthesis lipoprotein